MELWHVARSRCGVTLAALTGEPLAGWHAELAKIDVNHIPAESLEEWRANLPDTVPEYADITPYKWPPRWKFWRYW